MNTIDQELINVRADEKLNLNKLKTYLKNELDYSFDNIEIFQFFIFAIKNKQYFTLNNKENDEQKYSPFVGNSYNDNCRIGFNCLRAY